MSKILFIDEVHKEFLLFAPKYEDGFDDFKKNVSAVGFLISIYSIFAVLTVFWIRIHIISPDTIPYHDINPCSSNHSKKKQYNILYRA